MDERREAETAVREYFRALEAGLDVDERATGVLADRARMFRAENQPPSSTILTIHALQATRFADREAEVDLSADLVVTWLPPTPARTELIHYSGPVRLVLVGDEWKIADYFRNGMARTETFVPLEADAFELDGLRITPRCLLLEEEGSAFVFDLEHDRPSAVLGWSARLRRGRFFRRAEVGGLSPTAEPGKTQVMAGWEPSVRARPGEIELILGFYNDGGKHESRTGVTISVAERRVSFVPPPSLPLQSRLALSFGRTFGVRPPALAWPVGTAALVWIGFGSHGAAVALVGYAIFRLMGLARALRTTPRRLIAGATVVPLVMIAVGIVLLVLPGAGGLFDPTPTPDIADPASVTSATVRSCLEDKAIDVFEPSQDTLVADFGEDAIDVAVFDSQEEVMRDYVQYAELESREFPPEYVGFARLKGRRGSPSDDQWNAVKECVGG